MQDAENSLHSIMVGTSYSGELLIGINSDILKSNLSWLKDPNSWVSKLTRAQTEL